MNFSTFDYLKTNYGGENDNPLRILALGGVAGYNFSFAFSSKFINEAYGPDHVLPLGYNSEENVKLVLIDHWSSFLRQVKGTHYTSIANAFTTIYQKETIRGFYKGMIPNAIKVVPNNGIRFLAYTYLTKWMVTTSILYVCISECILQTD